MRTASFVRPRTSTQDGACFCRVPEFDPSVLVESVDIRWNSSPAYFEGLTGGVSMYRNGSVDIEFTYTAVPPVGSAFFGASFYNQLTVNAGFYSSGAAVAHTIPLYGCQKTGMELNLATLNAAQGAFNLQGRVSFTFSHSDDDTNPTTVGGSGNNSNSRPWYFPRV